MRHVAVWIDHLEAKIFHIEKETFTESTLEPRRHVRRHSTTTAEHDHPADAEHFYHAVVRALEGAEEVLIVGPATAKLELFKHIQVHDHALVSKIVGVETVDHPTDKQLAAHARKYFRAVDSGNSSV